MRVNVERQYGSDQRWRGCLPKGETSKQDTYRHIQHRLEGMSAQAHGYISITDEEDSVAKRGTSPRIGVVQEGVDSFVHSSNGLTTTDLLDCDGRHVGCRPSLESNEGISSLIRVEERDERERFVIIGW